jgi:uncharacterized metal-binding protein YceD (DUF177 family)
MGNLVEYTLPISGMKNGMHAFDYQVRDEFFSHFEHSLIQNANVQLTVSLDKRPDLMILNFDFGGSVRTACDRCLEDFDLPVSGQQVLMVKYDESTHDDEEVFYITRSTQELDIAEFVYEFISLALPMVKTHDDAGSSCNPEMLKYLNHTEETDTGNPLRDVLKKISDN